MKNDRSIKLVTDDAELDPVHPLDAADQSIESDEIDRLLRLCADESTANIDFEAIKQRAVSSAKLKKAKRGKFRRAASYALFACASLVLGFTLLSVLKLGNKPGEIDVAVMNTPGQGVKPPESPGGYRGSSDGTAIWRVEAGAVSNDAYKDITKKVSDFFPDALPENMVKIVEPNEGHASAYGMDRNGEGMSYDFVMSTEPPVRLEAGEACSVEDGDSLVYYWQVSEENCVSVRFAGFEQQKADLMFNSIAKRIVQIVPNDGQR